MTASSSLILKFRTGLGLNERDRIGAVADTESEEAPSPTLALGVKGRGGTGMREEAEEGDEEEHENALVFIGVEYADKRRKKNARKQDWTHLHGNRSIGRPWRPHERARKLPR